MAGEYPRHLSPREREWISWVLPAERAGYRDVWERIESLDVIGDGRRGKGEIILGPSDAQPDLTNPLPPVFAYGVIETDAGPISVTIREILEDQVSVEIVNQKSDEVPEKLVERRRWTYSRWSPGQACPQCDQMGREVSMSFEGSSVVSLDLAICPADKRLWVHDRGTGVNRLIPVTNFYNELMLHKNVRDPKIALDSKIFFMTLDRYSDADLRSAFQSYNKLKTKVHLGGTIDMGETAKSHRLHKLFQFFRRP